MQISTPLRTDRRDRGGRLAGSARVARLIRARDKRSVASSCSLEGSRQVDRTGSKFQFEFRANKWEELSTGGWKLKIEISKSTGDRGEVGGPERDRRLGHLRPASSASTDSSLNSFTQASAYN